MKQKVRGKSWKGNPIKYSGICTQLLHKVPNLQAAEDMEYRSEVLLWNFLFLYFSSSVSHC